MIMVLFEKIANWYERGEMGKLRYFILRFLIPYLLLTGLFSLATMIYRSIGWGFAVATVVGMGAFVVGLVVGMLGLFVISLSGGVEDKGLTVLGILLIIAIVLVGIGLVSFSSLILSFSILGLEAPVGLWIS